MMGPIDEFPYSPPLPSRRLMARVAERWHGWRERRRWIGEVSEAAQLGRLDDILNDVSLTRAELDGLIEGPADAGRQLDQLAAMAQVDLGEVEPAVLREATWVCTRCEIRDACKHWLNTGVWNGGDNTRCPNAALLRH
jgi:uncharacterized protein DUF6455